MIKGRLDVIAQWASDLVLDALLSKDPNQALLQLGISQAKVDDFMKTFVLINNPFHYQIALAKFGKLVEIAAAPIIKGDIVLGQLTRYVADAKNTMKNSSRQPDFWMRWQVGGAEFIMDITRPARDEAHMKRGKDWETALYIHYEIRLPSERK